MNNNENYYYIIKDYAIEDVGKLFFSKSNVDNIQKAIKNIILKSLNVELTQNQNTESLLMIMRYVYLQDGRFLKYNITEQVNTLNKKLLNIIIPDIITGVKQQLEYNKYINNPINPIDRPFSDSIKGSKMPKPISNLWLF